MQKVEDLYFPKVVCNGVRTVMCISAKDDKGVQLSSVASKIYSTGKNIYKYFSKKKEFCTII